MRNLVFLLLFLFSQLISAQVYKWVDENGKTQYTDQPPPSGAAQNEQKLKIPSAPPSSAKQPSTLSDEKDAFDKRREEKLEEKSRQVAKAEEDKQICIDAQGRIKVFRDSPRLTMPDGKGGIVYVDDDMRQAEINKLNDVIAKHCK